MRNVMIVDDEALVRIGLQSIIDWESRGYRVAGVFKNGEEALAAARGQSFDIVLTDIRMPGMDGFELIRELKRIDTGMKFIVLSSYSDFEYTRQAIREGVSDYISKYAMEPVELLKVLDALSFPGERGSERSGAGGIGAASEAESGPGRDARRVKDPDHSGKRLAEEKTKLLHATGEDEGFGLDEQFPALRDRLSAWGTEARWIVLYPMPRESGYSLTERKAIALQTEEIFSRLDGLEYFGELDGRLHGICVFGDEEPAEDGIVRLHQQAEELKAAWAKNLNIGLVAGIGSARTLAETGRSRKEAEQAAQLCFYSGPGAYFREQSDLRAMTEQEWLDGYKRAKNEIEYLRFDELESDIRRRLNQSRPRYYPGEWLRAGEMIATHLLNLLIERYDVDMESVRGSFGRLWPVNEAFRKAGTRKEFLVLSGELFARAKEVVASLEPSRSWLVKAKEYVEARFGEPIRLEDAAEHVSFSPSYFSQRFRQETGEAFSDYVTRVRIREAIRLYKESDCTTEEIAARVGYMNANYFIKVFKRTTGQTVKQFKGKS